MVRIEYHQVIYAHGAYATMKERTTENSFFEKARQTEERFLKSKEKTEKSSKTLKGKSARYRNRFNAEVRNVSLEEDSNVIGKS